MKPDERVAWREGMLMLPHHFQQAELSYEQFIARRVSETSRFAWGVRDVAFDVAALATGTVRLTKLDATTPAGTELHLDETTAISVDVAPSDHFDEVSIFVNVPDRNQRESPPEHRPCIARRRVEDIFTGEEQEIEVARPRIYLTIGSEGNSHHDRLEIGRMRWSAARLPVFCPDFVPACTRLSASPFLLARTREFIAKARSRCCALLRILTSRSPGDHPFSSGSDLSTFFQLQAVASALPLIEHALSADSHPEFLFLELSRLRGELSMAHLSLRDAVACPYRHTEIGPVVRELFSELESLFDASALTSTYPIRLECDAAGILSGDISPHDVMERGELFLILKQGVAAIDRFDRLVKVGSRDQIRQIVRSAMLGVPVAPVAHPPEALQLSPSAKAFRIERSGLFWDRVRATASLGIHVPHLSWVHAIELWGVVEARP